MSSQIAPRIDDGNLVIDDLVIAPETDVQTYEQTQSSAVDGYDTYRVRKTDGTVKEVRVLKSHPGMASSDEVYTKAQVDALIAAAIPYNSVRFDQTTGEIVYEKT